jgi:hypothetical protein
MPLSPIPGILSMGIILAFTYMCTQYVHHIYPPTPFFWYQSPPAGRTCYSLLLSDFAKEKEKRDILFIFYFFELVS